MSDKTAKLFVYGTLMRGEHNHSILGNSVYIKKGKTKPEFSLYSFGSFPALVNDGKDNVKGEVYYVSSSTIDVVDRLESHPSWYERKTIILEDGESVQAYVMPKQRALKAGAFPVKGDWKKVKHSKTPEELKKDIDNAKRNK
jgi:gamma-glutamylcyclotransferase (GGCT)/AIG2-like uncharacterized protein YtfP